MFFQMSDSQTWANAESTFDNLEQLLTHLRCHHLPKPSLSPFPVLSARAPAMRETPVAGEDLGEVGSECGSSAESSGQPASGERGTKTEKEGTKEAEAGGLEEVGEHTRESEAPGRDPVGQEQQEKRFQICREHAREDG